MYLNLHSYYSLRYGTLSVEQLLEMAIACQVDTLALTDINTSQGIPEFVKKAEQKGIKPIAGIEFRNGDELLFIGLARNREGLRELNEYLSWHNLKKRPFELAGWKFNHTVILYPFVTDLLSGRVLTAQQSFKIKRPPVVTSRPE
jgi:DNA polymerase-3 subunit alpha